MLRAGSFVAGSGVGLAVFEAAASFVAGVFAAAFVSVALGEHAANKPPPRSADATTALQ
jgi:hypothetical protein